MAQEGEREREWHLKESGVVVVLFVFLRWLLSQRSRFRGCLFTVWFLQCLGLFTTLRLHFNSGHLSSTAGSFSTYNWPKMTKKGNEGKGTNLAHNLCTKKHEKCFLFPITETHSKVLARITGKAKFTHTQGVQSKYYFAVQCDVNALLTVL